jgi:hypothetical protein
VAPEEAQDVRGNGRSVDFVHAPRARRPRGGLGGRRGAEPSAGPGSPPGKISISSCGRARRRVTLGASSCSRASTMTSRRVSRPSSRSPSARLGRLWFALTAALTSMQTPSRLCSCSRRIHPSTTANPRGAVPPGLEWELDRSRERASPFYSCPRRAVTSVSPSRVGHGQTVTVTGSDSSRLARSTTFGYSQPAAV